MNYFGRSVSQVLAGVSLLGAFLWLDDASKIWMNRVGKGGRANCQKKVILMLEVRLHFYNIDLHF